VASEVPARAPEAAPRPTADGPEPCPVAADRPAQRTQGGGLRPRRRPGDIRGAGLAVAAGPLRSPLRIRSPAPPGPGRNTTSDSRRSGAAPRRRRPACAADARGRPPPRAETADPRRAGLPVAARPSRRDRTSEVPCPVPQALNSGQYPPERPHLAPFVHPRLDVRIGLGPGPRLLQRPELGHHQAAAEPRRPRILRIDR